MNVRLCLVSLSILLFAGCEVWSDDEGNAAATSADSLQADAIEEGAAPEGYRVILTGAMVDTLTGNAIFGEVFKVATRRTESIIELEAGSDFTGGFFITLGDTTLPQPGTYDLTVPTEGGTATMPPYRVIYRRGLILNIESVQGSLTFDTVSDTLLQGSFNALLQGDVPVPGAGVQKGEVRARGWFEAREGPVGFIVGLQ